MSKKFTVKYKDLALERTLEEENESKSLMDNIFCSPYSEIIYTV